MSHAGDIGADRGDRGRGRAGARIGDRAGVVGGGHADGSRAIIVECEVAGVGENASQRAGRGAIIEGDGQLAGEVFRAARGDGGAEGERPAGLAARDGSAIAIERGAGQGADGLAVAVEVEDAESADGQGVPAVDGVGRADLQRALADRGRAGVGVTGVENRRAAAGEFARKISNPSASRAKNSK